MLRDSEKNRCIYNVPGIVVGVDSIALNGCNRASVVDYTLSDIYTDNRNLCGVYDCDNIKIGV